MRLIFYLLYAGKRGQAGENAISSSGVADRMLSVLLTEMDGLDSAAGAALMCNEEYRVNMFASCTAACMQDPTVRLMSDVHAEDDRIRCEMCRPSRLAALAT